MRREYRLSETDYARLVEASRSVMYIVANGVEPESPRDAAMRIWREIADHEGVDVDSIEPGPSGKYSYTAVPKAVPR